MFACPRLSLMLRSGLQSLFSWAKTRRTRIGRGPDSGNARKNGRTQRRVVFNGASLGILEVIASLRILHTCSWAPFHALEHVRLDLKLRWLRAVIICYSLVLCWSMMDGGVVLFGFSRLLDGVHEFGLRVRQKTVLGLGCSPDAKPATGVCRRCCDFVVLSYGIVSCVMCHLPWVMPCSLLLAYPGSFVPCWLR